MEFTETKVKSIINEKIINQVNDDTLDQLLKISISHTCGKSDSLALTQICSSKPDVIKAAFIDITKLLVEAGRHDTSSEELNSLLHSTSLNKTYIDKICEFYSNHKELLHESLESIGNGLPHIIDVDWRLDYCIMSSINNPAGFPTYFVSLSTIKHGTIERVKFTCTIQQLQELVYKLKDAARHVEKLANPS